MAKLIKKMISVVPTSISQDGAVDRKRGCYYVSGNDPGRMVIVDSTTLEITGEVLVPSDVDLIGYDPITEQVHMCNDKAAEQWVIDPATKKIVSTIKFSGSGVEDLAFDPGCKHLYQAVKGSNTVAVIDPVNNAVTATWPCAPDGGVHGIIMVQGINSLLVACAGKLVLFDCATGKVTATAPTAARVDEITYDPGRHVAYCASRMGKISAVAVAAGQLTPLEDTPDPTGTGDIAVDPQTHLVWIGYEKDGQCYVQSFAPAQ
jgi:YVTN family beta-propeller protein